MGKANRYLKKAVKEYLNQCTPFSRNVYCTVMRIPKGEVRTYQWVAHAIGLPRACRAVGNALNKNMFPIIIPCHRVIASDGSLGGYSGGLKKKKELLKKEGWFVK